MSRIFKSGDYSEKLLRIRPEGWIDDLVFEPYFQGCGQAHKGMGIRINNTPGGVLTLDDMTAIIDAFGDHFENLAKDIKEAPQTPTEDKDTE